MPVQRKEEQTMKSHVSLTGLSIAVLMFGGTVAMHQAARAENVFTGSLAPVAKKLLPDDVFTGSVAPVAKKLLSEEKEDFEGKHHGKHGKKGKHHDKHGKKGKHHDKHEEKPSTLEVKDLSILY
jgi:hypothetical protein